MAIEAIGATITFAASSVGTIVEFETPEDVVKKYETTGLGDTREQFSMSAMSVGQTFRYVVRLDPEAQPVSKGSSGEFIVTLPKQTPGSVSGKTYTFTGFVERESGVSGSVTGAEGLTQEFEVQLTTEVTAALEA